MGRANDRRFLEAASDTWGAGSDLGLDLLFGEERNDDDEGDATAAAAAAAAATFYAERSWRAEQRRVLAAAALLFDAIHDITPDHKLQARQPTAGAPFCRRPPDLFATGLAMLLLRQQRI